MKKILYVMNVNWNWIKQRPHYLAEELAKYYDIEIVYPENFNKKGYQNRSTKGLKIKGIKCIPFIDRINSLKIINEKIRTKQIINNILINNYDIIYLTYPTQVDAIPKNFSGILIYDCMDNYPAFISSSTVKSRIINKEKN